MAKEIISRGKHALVIIVACASAVPAAAQPVFELLKAPAHEPWADFSLSRDGRQMGCVFGGAVYWWTAVDGYRFLDAGVPSVGGVGMAADGTAIAAARTGDGGAVPTVWLRDGTTISLGSLAGTCDREHPYDGGFDVSAGGLVAVGQAATCAEDVAFVWTRKSGLRGLETPEGSDSRGVAISADGDVVVGFCEHPREGYRRPALWRGSRGPELFLGPNRTGEALGVSLDGTRVVGQADLGGASPQAFLWNAASGVINLGSLGGRIADASVARAVSDDGRVVGWSGDALWGDQVAFLWTATSGMRPLATILADYDVSLPDGMVLTAALDISGDGTTVVGTARDRDWTQQYWRILLDTGVGRAPETPPLPTERPDTASSDPDSMNLHQADMLDLLPFTRRRY